MAVLDDSWRSHVYIEPCDVVCAEPARDEHEANASAAVWVYYGRMETRELAFATPDGGAQEEPVPVLRSDPWAGEPGGLGYEAAQQAFSQGYLEAGGDPALLSHIIHDVIGDCEYGWQPYVKVNYYESRAQFDPGSWTTAGGGDPADDYTVGRNTATWISLIEDPGSTSGWPVCWHVGGW